MKDKLIELFLSYQKTQDEYTSFMSTNNPLPNWDYKRLANYFLGIVSGKFVEQDEETLKAINMPISEQEVKREISSYYKCIINEISCLDIPDMDTESEIKKNQDILRDLESLDLKDWIKKHNSVILDFTKAPINSWVGLIYIYYSYEMYKKEKNSIYNSAQDKIFKLYDDVIHEIPSLSKYGLIPIDMDRELICIDPARIYDKKISKTLFLKNIPLSIAHKFQELLDEKLIGEISFRVSNSTIFDGYNDNVMLLEHVERGSIFNPLNINVSDITKLYSDNFHDCLWVTTDNNNITFEELCDDFNIYEDMITTQVIHLQYTQKGKDTIITHLDHEYIFYNEDEYQVRLNNPYQKGTASRRIKTFKIDKSCIPFTAPCIVQCKDNNGDNLPSIEVPFIYFILNNYFKHKKLLYEYFQNILM